MQNKNIFHPFSLLFLLLLSFASLPLFSQTLLKDSGQAAVETSNIVPLDVQSMMLTLQDAPLEGSAKAKSEPLSLILPLPNGGEAAYQVEVSHILEESDRLAYPDIKTYRVFNETDHAYGRMVLTPSSLHAYIITEHGSYFIDPLDNSGSALHRVFFQESHENALCGFHPSEDDLKRHHQNQSAGAKMVGSNGAQKRTYRMAITTTGEFFQHVNFGNNSLATAINRITQIVSDVSTRWELEMAVSFTLVTVNNAAIYTNPGSDPYDPGNTNTYPDQAAMGVGMHYTTGQYDIGHLLHGMAVTTGGLGIASLGVVCSNNAAPLGGVYKAAGWSGGETVSLLGINIMVHEVGHMYSMTHTFNGDGNSCAGSQYPTTSAYEIGSGTTIMSYNGACGAGQNIPSVGAADEYFHTRSLEQAVNYIVASGGCATTANLNTPPVVDANPGACGTSFTIPKSTPFRLTGSGSDADGDQVYYCWEQINEAANNTQGFIGAAAAGDAGAPLYRSFPPTTSPTRYFPNIELIKTGSYLSDWEPLSTIARTMRFGLTGRDWKPGTGGIHGDSLDVTVSASGPFSVTFPNVSGHGPIAAGGNPTVTWAVNGTNAFCPNVNILLSVDGGTTYPYTLLTTTSNDGSESVTIPSGVPATTTARIMVECASNTCVVFFDISDGNFTITSACNAAGSNICPATALSLPAGDAGLSLGLSGYFGSAVTSNTFTINGGSPTGPLANATVEGGTICQTAWGTEKYATFDFAVSATGSYTFNNTSGGQVMYSVFVSSGYNPAAPCSGTFVESNSWAAIGWNQVAAMTLNACTVYKMVVWTLSGANATPTITMSGPGTIYSAGSGPGGNYSYTYAAVNTATGQVAAVSATSNFTSLATGSYLVYGASYHSGAGPNPPTVNPATWVGQTLSAILSGGSCVVFSFNSKPVTVTAPAGTPSIAISGSPSLNEGNAGSTAFTFTVTRTGSTVSQSTASWAVTGSGGSSANAADFGGTLPGGTVTFPAGSSATQTITVNVSGDTDVEPDEGFTVTLSNPTNATITTATASGTILNDDGTPSLAISGSPSMNEGNAGNTAFTFTVTRTGNTASQSTASWAVTGSGGSPADAADFGGTLPSGTVTFPAGSSATQTITVNVSGDTDVEPNEGFTVTLSAPTNATISTATASGTIQNDDAAPVYCAAGTPNNTGEKISIVQFNTINNTSSSNAGYEDFTAVSTSVAQGATHAFTATISDPFGSDEIIVWIDYNQDFDFIDPGEEAFNSPTGNGPHGGNITIPANATTGATRMRVRLHDTANGPNATPCGNSDWGQVEDYTINITASGGTPSIAISGSPSLNEGNSGNTAFTFTVTRTGSTTNASSASWAVTGSGGNPAVAADFGGTLPSGTVTFPAGSSATQTITVNVSGDTGVEPDEGFTVTLSSPTNATIGTATASGTIVNDDASIAISGSPSLNEGNAGNTAFTFTVTRTGSTASQSTASWAVTGSGGSPANAADFGGTLPSGTVTFPAGSSATQTITVNVSGDTGVEPDEGFTVTLSNPTNATIGTATASGTILNDDSTPSLAISGSPSMNEGNAGNTAFTFTVTRTGNTASQSTASWAVTGSGGSPANAADFGGTLPSGTVTFPAGSSATQTITVNVSGDTDVEPNEGFTVTLSAPTNATITTATASGTIQNDDSAGGCPFVNITCGVAYNGTTVGAASSIPSYSCVGWDETGPEVLHQITTTATGNITATLSNLGAVDLDVFIIGSDCNPNNCILHGNNTFTANVPAGTYYIVVDGYEGASGTYTLLVESNNCSGGTAGKSLDFDGTNDYVSLPANLTASLTNFTFEAWVYWDGSSNWQRIVDFGENTTKYMFLTPKADVTNKPRFAMTATGSGAEQQINSSVAATPGQWQHYAIVLDDAANTGVLYMDGVQVGSNTNMTLTPAAMGNLPNNYFSKSQFADDPLNGKLDDVRIWNFAKTSQQVQCEMDETLAGTETGLVAHYNFNQGTAGGANAGVTTLNDLTANNYDGTLTNFALTGSSSNWSGDTGSGKVLDFVDGDYVTGTNASLPVGNAARTIECWVKTAPASTGYEAIFYYGTVANNQRAALYLNNGNGALYYSAFNNDLTGGPNLRDGIWHHCAATFDGTTMRLYVDGNEVGTGAKTFNTIGTAFEIGGQIGAGTEYLDGKLDEVRVWNVARTQDQIRAYKNVQLSGAETGLVAYYPFNQGIAGGTNTGLTTLEDRSPTNADGTLTGFALTGATSNWAGPGALTDAPGLGCCPTVLYVNGVITSGTYHATTEVYSDGTLPAGATVTFKGATGIVLQPNFLVTMGAIFDVLMQACTP